MPTASTRPETNPPANAPRNRRLSDASVAVSRRGAVASRVTAVPRVTCETSPFADDAAVDAARDVRTIASRVPASRARASEDVVARVRARGARRSIEYGTWVDVPSLYVHRERIVPPIALYIRARVARRSIEHGTWVDVPSLYTH